MIVSNESVQTWPTSVCSTGTNPAAPLAAPDDRAGPRRARQCGRGSIKQLYRCFALAQSADLH
jgi:hypothetical protein